jgi:hypothetical protein
MCDIACVVAQVETQPRGFITVTIAVINAIISNFRLPTLISAVPLVLAWFLEQFINTRCDLCSLLFRRKAAMSLMHKAISPWYNGGKLKICVTHIFQFL